MAPKLLLHLTKERLSRRKAVTIIAGFKCADGIVLCADTQETMNMGDVSVSKRRVPKLRYEHRYLQALSGMPNMAVAICGAGYGPMIDKLADEIWKAADGADNLPNACDAMEERIKALYTEFGQIYQQNRCPEVELLYGITSEGRARLFYANGPIVNEKDAYYAAGTGSYMADYLASNMYDQALSVRQCVILAAYMLAQTKEHADGCGGESHIAVLREKGTSGRVGWTNTESITRLVQHSHRQVGELLMAHANLSLKDEEFLEKINGTLEGMKTTRNNERESLQRWDEIWGKMFAPVKFDDLGLIYEPGESAGEDLGSSLGGKIGPLNGE